MLRLDAFENVPNTRKSEHSFFCHQGGDKSSSVCSVCEACDAGLLFKADFLALAFPLIIKKFPDHVAKTHDDQHHLSFLEQH